MSNPTKQRGRWGAVAAVSLMATSVLAACASDDSSSDSTSPEASSTVDTSDAVATADAAIEPYLEDPTSINISTPLSGPVPEGMTVAYLVANVDVGQRQAAGLQSAAEALGWDVKLINYDLADPQSISAALQQAVDQGVDYVAESGSQPEALQPALDNAKAAGIPVVIIGGKSDPTQADAGILGCIACDSFVTLAGQLSANYAISDSDAKANAVFFTLPELASVKLEGEEWKKALESGCPDCSGELVETTLASYATGAIPAEIVSYLQAHPDVKYVTGALGGMTSGLPAALDLAGITDVKITSVSPGLDTYQDIIDGKQAAAVGFPITGGGYAAVDLMARDSLGMDLDANQSQPVPTKIVTKDNVGSEAAYFTGAPDTDSLFKALWLVG